MSKKEAKPVENQEFALNSNVKSVPDVSMYSVGFEVVTYMDKTTQTEVTVRIDTNGRKYVRIRAEFFDDKNRHIADVSRHFTMYLKDWTAKENRIRKGKLVPIWREAEYEFIPANHVPSWAKGRENEDDYKSKYDRRECPVVLWVANRRR